MKRSVLVVIRGLDPVFGQTPDPGLWALYLERKEIFEILLDECTILVLTVAVWPQKYEN